MKVKNLILRPALIISVVAFAFTSCTDDTPKGEYNDGIFITNEGTNNNGSVSFYSYGGDKVINQVFQARNKRPLGTYVQSLTVHGDQAFIVVNGSNKVEVTNKNTMEEQAAIEGISSPRYLATKNNKAYVSCWGDNSVKVVDLGTYTVSKSVSVASGPEKMHIKGNKLYVLNSGGWSYDSVLSVIDLETEKVVTNLVVPHSPIDIVEDNDGYIWILCKGKQVFNWEPPYNLLEESPSSLVKVDPESNQILLTVSLFENMHPTCLEIEKEGKNLYIGGGYGFQGIYKMDIQTYKATQISDVFAYGFNIDTKSDVLFVCVSPDFSKSGTLIRMDLNGSKLGEYTVGIGPNGTTFK